MASANPGRSSKRAHALWATVRNKFVPHHIDDEMVEKVLERKDRDEQLAESHYHMDDFNAIRFEDEKNILPVIHEMFLLGCLPIIPFVITSIILPTKFRFDYQSFTIAAIVIFEIALFLWASKTLRILDQWDIFSNVTENQELQAATHEMRKQKWFVFMVIFSSLAGCLFGEVLYRNYAFPYYQYMHLKWVNGDVSPLLQPGKMIQDAGVLRFSKDSYLDRAHSSCYRSQDAYCIAPIVQPNPGQVVGKKGSHILPSSPSGTYDYFAVGKNCCGCPGTGDFQCGDWAFGSGQGGLRVLAEADRANYYLAVQQWNAQNKVTTKTPIFLKWVNRPFEKIRDMKAGYWYYGVMVTIAYFCGLMMVALVIHSSK